MTFQHVRYSFDPDDILDRYRETAPVDVLGAASELGISVLFENLPDTVSGVIRRSRHRGGPDYVIEVNRNHSEGRQRFTLAHELGHYVLHRDLIGDGITDDAMYRSPLGDKFERQANRYAANLLMPPRLIRKLHSEGKGLAELARLFQVSQKAMEIRFSELRIPSEGVF